MEKIKDLFKYEKIVATIFIPVMGVVASYVGELNHKINSLESWKIQVETRNTADKLSDLKAKVINLEREQSIINEKIDVLREKQEDRAKRSNVKFDEHERDIRQNAIDIAFLKGIGKRNPNCTF